MKWQKVLLTLLFALLVSSTAFAQTTTQPSDLVTLRDGQEKYPLGRHLEILMDASGELTFQEVSSAAYQDRFTPSQVDVPNFGFQKAVYWVRFRVRSQAEQNRNWVLELNFINMHYVDLYLPSADGSSYLVKESGVLRPYKNRDIPYRRMAFNLDIPPGSEQNVYLRFQSESSMTLPLILWSRSAFTNYMLVDQLIFGIFFGAMIIMALYNLLLWYLIRQRPYLYLALFIISWLGSNLFYRGIIYRFVQISSYKLATSPVPVFLGL
ncbi:MAG: 7TM-DISM domain-containing protein, partial [Anaerolineales bacterium]